MKNITIIILCICFTLVVLLLRSEVYDIPSRDYRDFASEEVVQDTSPQLLIHYHERSPYYTEKQGDIHGLVADSIRAVLNHADITFQWQKTPAGRQLGIIRESNGPVCAAGWFKTPAREVYAKFSLPVYQDKPLVGLTRADNTLIEKTDTLERVMQESRLRMLAKKGYSYGRTIDEMIDKYRPWTVVTTGNNSEQLKMIHDHRADYCLMGEEEAYDLLLFSGVNKTEYKIVTFTDTPVGNLRYLICSMTTPDSLLERINGAINHILPDWGKR